MNTTIDEQAIVYVVDDDEAVRDAVLMLLASGGFSGAGFPTAEDFLDSCDLCNPGCIVLDVRMPGMSGLELQRHLNSRDCLLPIIFVTGHGDIPMAVDAVKAGAVEFLLKPFDDEDLFQRVRQALTLNQELRAKDFQSAAKQARIDLLTPREHEVFLGLRAGKLSKQIAFDLGLSPRTVEIHRARVLAKLEVRSVTDLVRDYPESD